jgi:hypothetical protein
MQAKKDSQAVKTRLKDTSRQGMTQKQATKDSKAGNERLKGRQRKTQRQATKDSKAGNERLKGRQDWTQRQPI